MGLWGQSAEEGVGGSLREREPQESCHALGTLGSEQRAGAAAGKTAPHRQPSDLQGPQSTAQGRGGKEVQGETLPTASIAHVARQDGPAQA